MAGSGKPRSEAIKRWYGVLHDPKRKEVWVEYILAKDHKTAEEEAREIAKVGGYTVEGCFASEVFAEGFAMGTRSKLGYPLTGTILPKSG